MKLGDILEDGAEGFSKLTIDLYAVEQALMKISQDIANETGVEPIGWLFDTDGAMAIEDADHSNPFPRTTRFPWDEIQSLLSRYGN